jgi:flagellar biosynthetic protein FliR
VSSFATVLQIYAAGLVFARVGTMLMLIPGLGDAAVPPRIRLSLALLVAMVLAPVVAGGVTSVPGTVGGMGGAVIHEITVGLIIGSILRLFLTALATAGEVASIQTTLSFAQTANPALGQQGSTLGTFLGLVGVTLIMTTDLHHMFIASMVRSYSLFPFGHAVMVQDAGTLAIKTVSDSFALGVQLAAPVIVFSLVFNIATGLIGRVMPQFQVFFAATPLSLILGLSVFALSLGVVGMVWVSHYRDLLAVFT